MSKRVVVILVEGTTDKIALSGNLNYLVKDKTVEFEPTDGDITSDQELIGVADLNEILTRHVRRLISEHNDFTLDDVIEVVHLIDTDGLYVPDDFIVQKRFLEGLSITNDDRRPTYNDNSIEACNVLNERITLKNKRDSVRDLIEKRTLDFGRGTIKPYSVFYNSCNLEHALHDKRNVAAIDKRKLANRFAFLYYQNNGKFISLFDELNKSRTWDFGMSWAYLKNDFHSLERGSNFLIYLRKLNPEVVDCFVKLTK